MNNIEVFHSPKKMVEGITKETASSDGSKWRLTLKCHIPANSDGRDVHNYCNVRSDGVHSWIAEEEALCV